MENEFDVSTLSPEAQAYIKKVQADMIADKDRAVNSISQRKREEAAEALKNDQTFMGNLKKSWAKEYEDEAKKTAEEKAQDILKQAEMKVKEANKMKNSLSARQQFAKAEIPDEDFDSFSNYLVSDDENETAKRTNDFITSYKKSLDKKLEDEKKKYKLLETNPQQTGGTGQKNKTFSEMTMDERMQYRKEHPEFQLF